MIRGRLFHRESTCEALLNNNLHNCSVQLTQSQKKSDSTEPIENQDFKSISKQIILNHFAAQNKSIHNSLDSYFYISYFHMVLSV